MKFEIERERTTRTMETVEVHLPYYKGGYHGSMDYDNYEYSKIEDRKITTICIHEHYGTGVKEFSVAVDENPPEAKCFEAWAKITEADYLEARAKLLAAVNAA